MHDAATHPVTCPECDKRYRWKAELAGKKVRCACGAVMVMPDSDPTTEPVPQEDHSEDMGYELNLPTDAPEMGSPSGNTTVRLGGKCPMCNLPMSDGAVLCLNCGFDIRENTVRKPQVQEPIEAGDAPPPTDAEAKRAKRDAEMEADVLRQANWIDVRLPVLLLLAGVLFTGGVTVYELGFTVSAAIRTGVSLAIQTVVMVPLLLLCVWIVAQLLDVGFGPLQIAILKLSAIAIGALSFADMVAALVSPFVFGIAALFVYPLIYFLIVGSCLSKLFDLDFFETAILCVVMTLLRLFTIMFLLGLLL